MLLYAKSLKDLSFSKLMAVYLECNRENGAELAPEEPLERQDQIAEDMFYDYLKNTFFQEKKARYYIWAEGERYVSALRMEPFQDGYLLEALETAPEERRKGYGRKLVLAALDALSKEFSGNIYSHVSKKNIPSMQLHKSCGFIEHLDYAHYIDDSVNHRAYTLVTKI